MTPFAELVQQSAYAAWLFIPSAILLGALHGLEPGHSKTMMAAFIVAIRGTFRQAALLAITATISHTAIVWLVALLALTYGSRWSAEAAEPYFQIGSAVVIVGIALLMAFRTWQDQQRADHRHGDDDGRGHRHAHGHRHGHGHDHGHDHGQPHAHEHALGALAAGDAHARAHAEQIHQQFAGRKVTTGQIALFGLTGGLLPCPAAVTVLILCLQIQRFWLGITLVLSFSIGLALTLLASGLVAAWGIRHATLRWPRFDAALAKLPYMASAVIVLVGLYVAYAGFAALT